MQSASEIFTQRDDEPGSCHLLTRTYDLDVESEYASNQFAFIHPTDPHHSKYVLDSIRPIEKGSAYYFSTTLEFAQKLR